MLLQPYIENTIVHGLANKKGKRKVSIRFDKDEHHIVVRIRDNGIGREKAMELKGLRSGGQHKPRAMGITSERLNLLNEIEDDVFSLEINDLKTAAGKAMGTEVVIRIPDDLLSG
jgi:LytS/YehU family sensor histidine kinase